MNNKCLLVAAVVASLFTLDKARADIIILDNLAGSASDISGIKNAVDTSYYQGFKPSISGNLNSLIMDLGLQQVNNNNHTPPPPTPPENVTYDTMSISLWTATSSGDPVTEVTTLASGITVGDIESAGSDAGYTSVNDSFIYQYPVSLLNTPALTAGDYYAIEITLSDTPNGQEIGWAEETGNDPEPSGPNGKEVGELDPLDGYGRMELDMPPGPAPEPGSLALMALGGLGLLVRRKRKLF